MWTLKELALMEQARRVALGVAQDALDGLEKEDATMADADVLMQIVDHALSVADRADYAVDRICEDHPEACTPSDPYRCPCGTEGCAQSDPDHAEFDDPTNDPEDEDESADG